MKDKTKKQKIIIRTAVILLIISVVVTYSITFIGAFY